MRAPTIETERLRLRAFQPADAADYARVIFSDADVMRYMNVSGIVPARPALHAANIIAKRQDEWRSRGYSAWAVERQADGAFVGHVGLYIIDGTDVVEIGYALGRAYWGYGYAAEAARAALGYAFTVHGLDEIVAVAFPQNVPSQRVMQKLGMTDCGLTNAYYGLTLVCYKLTRADFLGAGT